MISVCIATYNGAEFIKEQLASILPQLMMNDEVIISDDGSTDQTLSIVKAFESPRIKIVKGPCKGSPALNFENALRHAKGDYIFLADQDDVWHKRKVERMMEELRYFDCVVSDCYVTDRHLQIVDESFYNTNNTHSYFWYNLLCRNGYLGCCMAFRRNVLLKALPFPENIPMHDIWIGNVAAAMFRLNFIGDRLIYFRRHKHNASVTAQHSPYPWRQRLKFRWRVMKPLFKMITEG